MFSGMNTLDWIIAVLLIGGGIYGYSRGFISQLISNIGLFLAYVAAKQTVVIHYVSEHVPLVFENIKFIPG